MQLFIDFHVYFIFSLVQLQGDKLCLEKKDPKLAISVFRLLAKGLTEGLTFVS